MKLSRLGVFALASSAALIACTDVSPSSGYGFTLPEGDPEIGRLIFADYYCYDCHAVEPDPMMREQFGDIPYYMTVTLGGETSRIQTYGELVTSIINPSHRISARYQPDPLTAAEGSPMRNYNDLLRVSELIDLVAYVQDQYELVEPPQTDYSMYGYP